MDILTVIGKWAAQPITWFDLIWGLVVYTLLVIVIGGLDDRL